MSQELVVDERDAVQVIDMLPRIAERYVELVDKVPTALTGT